MKRLRWKIRYALAIRRLLRLSLWRSWWMAGAAAADCGEDLDIWTPESAAEEEADEWLRCC